MNYFVIQVKSRGEEKYMKLILPFLENQGLRLLWPRRRLTILKKGKKQETLAPIFPGYLFLETELLYPDLYWRLRKTDGFFRFLKSNHDICPLEGQDRELLLHFMSFGEIAERSKIEFDEHDKIRVISGPLKGLEGNIVKIDRRKGRAKVKLSLYEDSFLIDFGFESLQNADVEIKTN